MSQYERTNKSACKKHVARLIKCMNSVEKVPSDSIKSSYRYYTKLLSAWPDWCSKDPEIRRIYKRAQRTGKTVDHIVPLSSPVVCGLHVPANLQVLSLEQNLAKSNKWWPDCPHENCELFPVDFEPYQMVLI